MNTSPPTIGRQREYDAIVVGARAAGASTAMLLARAGRRVLLVDRAAHGTDTLSTHALLRGGVIQLQRFGLLDEVRAAGTPAIRRTVFHYGEDTIDRIISDRDGIDALYAPRRTVLDAILADAASEAGAEVVYGVRIDDVRRDARGSVVGITADGAVAHAPIVVGADGISSTVARLVDAPDEHVRHEAGAYVYGYFDGLPDADTYHWFFRPGASAGVIPTNGGVANVFVGSTQKRFAQAARHRGIEAHFAEVLADAAPEVAAALRGKDPVARFRSFPGRPSHLRRAYGPGWALVGDAGYFKDPIGAHGITDALRDAELLADAIIAGDLAAYQATRDLLSRRFMDVTAEVATHTWSFSEVMALHLEMKDAMEAELTHLASAATLAHSS